MLIDRYLPKFDVTQICEASVDAPPEAAYAAIRGAELNDPIIDLLFAVRELPQRIARRMRGERRAPPLPKVTFGDLPRLVPGWVLLAEEPGTELVVGSVGQVWRRDYGGREVTAEEFERFGEPGYAKIALSLAVRPAGSGAIVSYEARTATTDESARRKFRRYWRLIAPGVALVMRRALRRIRMDAERHAALAA